MGSGAASVFLHDGRADSSNGGLLTAIEDHAGSGSEANRVINLFQQLNAQQQQDLLNFLTVAVASAAMVSKMLSKKSVLFAAPEEDTLMQI